MQKWAPAIDGKLFPGNQVNYLIDGPATYQAMFNSLQSVMKDDARGYYIYLLGWWLDSKMPLVTGDNSSSLWEMLKRASARGVQIRVMLWQNVLESLYKDFYGGDSAKQQVRSINMLSGAAALLDDTSAVPFQAHHQKLLLIRGRGGLSAFCGGLDIAWDRIITQKKHSGSPMHDVHCQIEGPGARGLVDVFKQRWSAHPMAASIEKQEKLRCGRDSFPGPNDGKGPGNAQVAILRTYLDTSRHCIQEQSIRTSLRKMIGAAKRYIYVEDQYMTNLECATLLGQALGHVQYVFFLVAPSELSDLPGVWRARRAFLDAVKQAAPKTKADNFRVFFKLGAKSYGVAPKRSLPFPQYQPDDWPTADDLGPHCYVHSKTWIFDDEVAVIGSANCNRRGWYFDSEVAAVIMDVSPILNRGSYSFAYELRVALWSEHLGVDPSKVRDWKMGGELWASEGLRPFLPGSKKNDGPWVRYYRDRADRDPQLVTGGFDTTEPEVRGIDFKSAIDQIADLSRNELKACQRPG